MIFPTSDQDIFDQLKERYGSQLQLISPERKKIFRAALANYIALKDSCTWKNYKSECMDCCIEGASMDLDFWDEDPELCTHIQACGTRLSDHDIEGLIESLTAQLKFPPS